MKLNLIYYKNVIDLAFQSFVASNGEHFTKCNGKYVLSKLFTKASLKQELEKHIASALRELLQPVRSACDKCILIGSCYPRDNILLDFKSQSYFPKKLESLMASKPSLKWLLREHDIEVDIDAVNEAFVSIFNSIFTHGSMTRALRSSCSSVIALSHRRLDCYALFKVIKWAYGSSNCVNMYKEKLHGHKQCMVALNDLVSKYIPGKAAVNSSSEFKACAHEVKGYLDSKLGM